MRLITKNHWVGLIHYVYWVDVGDISTSDDRIHEVVLFSQEQQAKEWEDEQWKKVSE
jgi:hypothetical protein